MFEPEMQTMSQPWSVAVVSDFWSLPFLFYNSSYYIDITKDPQNPIKC